MHNGASRNGGAPAGGGRGGREPGQPTGHPSRSRGRHRKRNRRSFWKELPVLVVVALALALVIKTYAIQAFYIPSGSMQKTLEIGDRVLINKLVYDVRGIDRGDIVVFNGAGSWDPPQSQGSSNIFSEFIGDLKDIVGANQDGDIYIKRVIGLPGDHVACCNAKGQITVNGVPLSEKSYLYPGNAPSATPFSITVPPGRLWVMGDHRGISYDSRGHMGMPGGGTIPESQVLGRAFVIIWPPSQWNFLNIPATFDQPKLNGSAAAARGSAKALAAAMNDGTALQASWTPLPLAIGFAGAIPLTLLQRSARRRLSRRASRWRFRWGRRSLASRRKRSLGRRYYPFGIRGFEVEGSATGHGPGVPGVPPGVARRWRAR
ncbi:MAG: signal peptidase I [Nocardiopsaceae bacterium]|nr:signal peptidase I [Nocardiopsaceae bacterium]